MSYVHMWRDAVELQRERLAEGPPRRATGSFADAMFLLVAMNRLTRACTFAARRFQVGEVQRQRIEAARDKFTRAYPELGRIRDSTEHFDEWLLGEGRGQQVPPDRYPLEDLHGLHEIKPNPASTT